MDKISGASTNQYQPMQSKPPVKTEQQAVPAAPAAPKDTVSIGSKIGKAISGTVKTLGSGIGLSSGVIGGGLLGGAIASSGSVVTGLLAKSVTLAAITSAGLTGAIVGAAAFGIAGAYGGWKMSDMIVGGAKWIKNKVSGGK